MGHTHAELMAQYAEDAKQHDEPWELWQHDASGTWVDCVRHPSWRSHTQYRRKPRTVMIGDIEVPEPCKVPLDYGQVYYVPDLTTDLFICRYTWEDENVDFRLLESNLVHLDRESAILHAKALIEVSKGWWKCNLSVTKFVGEYKWE